MIENNAISQKIEKIISENPVVLFMKGTIHMPACGFSNVVAQILQRLSIKFIGINVLEDEEIRQGIKDYSRWPTIPQLYIAGDFIGGADILRDLYKSGEIFALLNQKNIPYEQPITA